MTTLFRLNATIGLAKLPGVVSSAGRRRGGDPVAAPVAGWAGEYRNFTRPPPAGLAGLVESYAEAERQAEHNRSGRWKWIFGE